jgi:hypothetical protein
MKEQLISNFLKPNLIGAGDVQDYSSFKSPKKGNMPP